MNKDNIENYKKYTDRIELFKSFGYDLEKEREFVLEKANPIKGKILEIGTGKGHFAIALAKRGYSFITVDVSKEDQEFARMNLEHLGLADNVDFVTTDAVKLNFADDSFDTSFGINLIHHLKEPFRVIDEFLRVTVDGGKIIISDFNRKGFSIIEKIHKSEGNNHSSGNCTLNEIKEYVSIRSFNIEKYSSGCQDLIIIHKRSS